MFAWNFTFQCDNGSKHKDIAMQQWLKTKKRSCGAAWKSAVNQNHPLNLKNLNGQKSLPNSMANASRNLLQQS